MGKKTKRAAAFAAAMLIAFTGTGMASLTSDVASYVLTASAASESVSVTLTDLCMKTAASGEVIRNSAVIKEFTAEEITEGIAFNADSNTVIVLHYDDGDMTFNALTKKLTNNTRKSGIKRELFAIPHTVLTDTGVVGNYTINGFGPASFSVITTSKDKTTGNKGTYVTPINYEIEDADGHSFRDKAWLSDPSGPPGTELRPLLFDYEPDTEVFLSFSPGGNSALLRIDLDTQKVCEVIGQNGMPTYITLNSSMFPKAEGFKTVTLSGTGIKNQNTDYGETITVDGENVTRFTAEEIASGEVQISYYFKAATTSTSYDSQAKATFDMGDGNTVEYLFFGEYVVYNDDTRPAETAKDVDGNEYIEPDTGEKLPEALEEGKPIISNEILGTPEQSYDYMVSIYEGSKLYAELTKAQYETGVYSIAAYNPDKHYYVKVGAENGEDGIWYKWDKKIGTWHKRINTSEDPTYTVQINPYTFPEDMYYTFSELQNVNVNRGNVYYNGNKKAEFTPEEFGKNYEYTITTRDCMDWCVGFEYGASAKQDDGTWWSENRYIYMGIDPEVADDDYYPFTETADFPVKTNAGDTIHVTGETYTGHPVDFSFTVPLGEGGDTIKLPKGEYTFENENTQLKDNASAGEDNEPEEVNLVDPVETSTFKVTTPDGELLDEGDLTDGVLDNVSDLNKTEDELGNLPYYGFETVVGIANTTDPEKLTTEKGYFIIKEDGTIEKIIPKSDLKGDVDLDGDVDVADIVMLQKYLLNAQSFGIENYINADVFTDGNVDVFDLALLKRIVISQEK